MPSVISSNVIANFAGKIWSVLISLAVVPFYLKFLGVEAYGLIGFFLVLGAIFSMLDFGLGTTLNRKLAQLSIKAGSAQEMRDLLRTLETVYWVFGLAIGLTIALLAPLIAESWINSKQLSGETVARSVMMMGIAIACHWPLALYSGGLMGMQKQVASNTIASLTTTVRNVGGVFVVWQIAPTLEAFFAWQILVSTIETVVTGIYLWRLVPGAAMQPRFSLAVLRSIWRFAAGITGISVLSVILTQLDKIILSKVLSLEAFAYYNLAWRVASGLYYLVSPINAAFFPRFAQLAALDDRRELARLYHQGCQLTAVVLLPVTVVLTLFSGDFLQLWIRDEQVTANSSMVLSLLAVGTALNGLMNLPLTLQLAYGWTKLVLVMNAAAVVLLAPMIYLVSVRYGSEGAAWIWIALNSCYVLFMMRMMHARLLTGHLREWFLYDMGLPLLGALSVSICWRVFVDMSGPPATVFIKLTAVSLLTALVAAAIAPRVRALVLQRLQRAPRLDSA